MVESEELVSGGLVLVLLESEGSVSVELVLVLALSRLRPRFPAKVVGVRELWLRRVCRRDCGFCCCFCLDFETVFKYGWCGVDSSWVMMMDGFLAVVE